MTQFEKYNYLVNETTGDIFPATYFYFYPLKIEDYIELYKKADLNEYPIMAFIYLTHKCEDRCPGCFVNSIEDKDAILSFEAIEKLLHDLKNGGTKAVKFAGREGTVSPHLSKTLELTKKLELKSMLFTSAACIHNHWESISENLTHLRISINTISEEYRNKLHYPSNEALRFNDRIKYIEKILEIRNAKKLISGATFLIRPETLDYADQFADLCKNIGFDYIRYTVLDDSNGNYPNNWEKMYYKILAREDEKFKIQLNNPPLAEDIIQDISSFNINLKDPAILSRVTIHANGNVNACQEGWRAQYPVDKMATFGNVNHEDFKNIWLGDKRHRFTEYIASNLNAWNERPSCCTNCKYENFNMLHHWIIEQITHNPNVKISKILLEMPYDKFQSGHQSL